jgi:tRNA dimethylallyltransferase
LLHRLLRRFDRSAANRIHPRDVQKLIRAVEICMLARRPVSEVHAAGRNPLEGFTILKLALDPPREALYERINRRTREMFQSGLLDEIRCILAAGYPPEAKPFDSVGYKQALAHLRGDMTLNEAIAAASQATRNYAKRQWTWFRREPGLQWLPAFGDDPAVQQEAIDGVRKFLERARPTWPATGVRF